MKKIKILFKNPAGKNHEQMVGNLVVKPGKSREELIRLITELANPTRHSVN